jgi:lysophospholipase L1-like esterase
VPFIKFYAGGWRNKPDPSTPVTAAALDHYDAALTSVTATAEAAAAGSAAVMTATAVKTANYTVGANEIVPFDASAGPLTATLPNAPADKTRATVKKIDGAAVTVACAGSDVFNKAGGSTTATLWLPGQALTVQYDATRHVWTVVADDLPLGALDGRYPSRVPVQALAKLAAGSPLNFAVFGDSVLQGSTAGTPGTDDAMSLLASTLTTRFGSTITKNNQALGGRTAFWEMVEKWDSVLATKPDLIVLGMTGKNDGAYEALSSGLGKYQGQKQSSSLATLETKIRLARRLAPSTDIVLMSGNPYGAAYTTINPVQKTYSQGLARLAAWYGLPYADGWNAITRVSPGSDYADPSTLNVDGVHPNSLGHAQLAGAVLALFPAGFDPAKQQPAPTLDLPPRLYPSKSDLNLVQLTTASVTPNIDRILTPAFMSGAWTGTGPWTTSTSGDLLIAKVKCSDFGIRFTYGSGQGTVDIIVDGQVFVSGLNLASVTDADQWVSIPDLAPGVHTIMVRQASGTVTVERMGYAAAASEFIDIRDARIVATNLGTASDINQFYGVHSNQCGSTTTITVPFTGTGFLLECYRSATGSGAYWSSVTIDGVAVSPTPTMPTGFGGTGIGYGSIPIVSGLDYGAHVAVLTFQAGTISVSGISVLDERGELRYVKTVGGVVPDASGNVAVPPGGAAINDTTASTSSVYSSTKTNTAIAAAIAALVNSSPSALDTLKELADAINDDASFAATMTTALAGKASLDGAGHVPLSLLPIGASFTITSPDAGTTWTDKAGTTITTRPSSRTDLVMVCETTGSTLPSFAITGDYLAKIA